MGTGWAAGLVGLAVSIGALAVIEVVVERRRFLVRNQYLAFLPGDVLLSLAAAIGWWGRQPGEPTTLWYGAPAVAGLAYGAVQMSVEVHTGQVSRGLAFSPSHLWHQLVTYPVLAALVLSAFRLAADHPARLALMCPLVLAWAGLVVWDRSHPKPAHVDFDWRGGSRASA